MADEVTRRSVKEGALLGVVAGLIFAVFEVLGAAMMGNPALMPFRMFASVVVGQAAMETYSIGAAFGIGLVAHVVLSAIFGLLYGIVNARSSMATQTNLGRQAGIGLLFGVAVYVVNFHVVARILYPWFLDAPQFLQLVMHALFFGLPLGLMYAGVERRVQHAPRPTHA